MDLIVEAGDVERRSPLVTVRIKPDALAAAAGRQVLGPGPGGGETNGGVCFLVDHDGPKDATNPIVAQYDPRRQELAFVIPDVIRARGKRRLTVTRGDGDARMAAHPVACIQKLDRVTFVVGSEPFATYNVLGGRRPYFWPILGPSGASVVRGQGTGEHPHHTGLGIAYGGHSEGGSSNIWSDWDETPYGPGGRMLHRGFRSVTSGPIYGELIEDLTYVNAHGDSFVDEIRTIRCWWASSAARFLDVTADVRRADDAGPQPFLFMIRLPGFFAIPEVGKVTNSVGYPVPATERRLRTYRAAWVDGSGPTGDPPAAPATSPPEVLVDMPGYEEPKEGPGSGPWNGIALFDHPDNDSFPGVIGKYAVPQQITQVHYPPADAPHGPFSFRHRVYVHDGDAEAAAVAEQASSYALPCVVEVRGE